MGWGSLGAAATRSPLLLETRHTATPHSSDSDTRRQQQRQRQNKAAGPQPRPATTRQQARSLDPQPAAGAAPPPPPPFPPPLPAAPAHRIHKVALGLLVQAHQPHGGGQHSAHQELESCDGEGEGEHAQHLLVVAAGGGNRAGRHAGGRAGRVRLGGCQELELRDKGAAWQQA